jgi:hypothetical protein
LQSREVHLQSLHQQLLSIYVCEWEWARVSQ